MNTLSKALAGTAAAGAMIVSGWRPALAAPARRHDNGVRPGEVTAGALIVGGIAAIASQNNNRPFVSPRTAVDQCVRAAERGASRLRGDVTDVRSVRQTRTGYEVRGRIAVKTFAGTTWRGKGQYGNGWGNDFRGWNNNLRGYDAGNFTCTVDRGRTNVNYSGIRGL